MSKAGIAIGAAAIAALALALAARHGSRGDEAAVTPQASSTTSSERAAGAESEVNPGLLHGRVTTLGGAVHEGRLRWGGDEEAHWGDFFNGSKVENPWAAFVPPERLPRVRHPIEFLGVEIARRERPIDLARPFMARFGDIARIEADGLQVRVTLKSGASFDLDRLEAGDFDDGVRIWDRELGVVDVESRATRSVEFFPAADELTGPASLHGTVRTGGGEFRGFIRWSRRGRVGSDELRGRSGETELSLRFDSVASLARRGDDGCLATLLDGREIALSSIREGGAESRSVRVDDPRYGRVLISWDAFERVDFSPGGRGRAYDDFPAGHPLSGSVTTRAGRRLAGRLVFDLDESETTETLDAPSRGATYSLPFALVSSIALPGPEEPADQHAAVTLLDGEVLALERAGDLGDGNAGLLVFGDGDERPEYVPWSEVERVDFDRPKG